MYGQTVASIEDIQHSESNLLELRDSKGQEAGRLIF